MSRFDGGDREVPGGIAGPVRRVLVVGAGLGTPVAGRVLFAGEHTQSARVGYTDGAMTSGIREAKRLLGAPR